MSVALFLLSSTALAAAIAARLSWPFVAFNAFFSAYHLVRMWRDE